MDYERIRKFSRDNPSKVTCRFCHDVRFYGHRCFYQDICPNCDSRAFDCRKVERVKAEDVPEGERIRAEWA